MGYSDLYDSILSAKPYTVRDVATTWRNFAEALRSASSTTQTVSDNVTAQDGAPYQNFGKRAAPVASWMNGVSSNAEQVASGLSTASSTASSAQMTAAEEDISFGQDVDRILGPQDALSMGRMNAINRREAQATAVMQAQITKMTGAYDAFQPGTIGAAPTTNSSGSPNAQVGSGTNSGTTGTNGSNTGNASLIGSSGNQNNSINDPAGPQGNNPVTNGGSTSDFPDSSVVGNDGGDFAGWVRDPRTGFLINPATGQEFDPITHRWIDPLTGRPFGDVVQQATRLEGLTGGGAQPGLLAPGPGTVGLAPTLNGGGSSNLPGMFGGLFPPSTSPSNPASRQLQQTALDRMQARAGAARQLALSEAAQGGRPYLPPTQAGMGAMPSGRNSLARLRLTNEPESTWTGRNGRTTRGGSLAEEPIPGVGGRRGGSGTGTANGQRLMPNGGMAGGGSPSSRKQQKSRKEAFPGSEDDEQLIATEDHNGSGVGKAALITTAVGVAGITGVAVARGGTGGGVAPLLPPTGGAAGTAAGGARGRGRPGAGRSGDLGMEAGRSAGSGSAGRRAYLPPMQGGQAGQEDKHKRQRPDWSVEDDIWSSGTVAGPSVLGED